MSLIKCAICDDNYHFANCLKMDAEFDDDIEFVGESHTSGKCIEMLKASNPDILLLDIQMETATSGIDIIPQVKNMFPNIKIVMLTVSETEDDIYFALKNGADGYILKTTPNPKVFEMLKNIYNNSFSIDNYIMKKYIAHSKTIENNYKSLLFLYNLISHLTKSELEILKALCMNKTYAQIASERYTEENTVRTLTSRIVKIFNVDNIKDLITTINDLRIFDHFDI